MPGVFFPVESADDSRTGACEKRTAIGGNAPMSTVVLNPPLDPQKRDRALAAVGIVVLLLLAVAITRHVLSGHPTVYENKVWLALHMATVIPALPLGAFVLVRRKGDALHKLTGRIWAGLMVATALSSFGLTGMMGHLSPIHLLSVLTLVAMPRAILAARSGRIAAHRRGMTIVYASMVVAGFFTFLPTRLLGAWLYG